MLSSAARRFIALVNIVLDLSPGIPHAQRYSPSRRNGTKYHRVPLVCDYLTLRAGGRGRVEFGKDATSRSVLDCGRRNPYLP